MPSPCIDSANELRILDVKHDPAANEIRKGPTTLRRLLTCDWLFRVAAEAHHNPYAGALASTPGLRVSLG